MQERKGEAEWTCRVIRLNGATGECSNLEHEVGIQVQGESELEAQVWMRGEGDTGTQEYRLEVALTLPPMACDLSGEGVRRALPILKYLRKQCLLRKRELESSLSRLSINRFFFSTHLFSEFLCLRTGGFTTFLSYDNPFFSLPQGIYFEFSCAFDFILLGALMFFLYHNPSCQCNFLLNLYYFSLQL